MLLKSTRALPFCALLLLSTAFQTSISDGLRHLFAGEQGGEGESRVDRLEDNVRTFGRRLGVVESVVATLRSQSPVSSEGDLGDLSTDDFRDLGLCWGKTPEFESEATSPLDDLMSDAGGGLKAAADNRINDARDGSPLLKDLLLSHLDAGSPRGSVQDLNLEDLFYTHGSVQFPPKVIQTLGQNATILRASEARAIPPGGGSPG